MAAVTLKRVNPRAPQRVGRFTVPAGRHQFPYQTPMGTTRYRRPRNSEEQILLAEIQLMEYLLRDKGFWTTAGAFPNNTLTKATRGGRPLSHPTWVFLLLAALTTRKKSQRKAIEFLNDVLTWQRLLATAHAVMPPGFSPASYDPPSRNMFQHFLRRFRNPTWKQHLKNAMAAAQADAVAKAKGRGLYKRGELFDYRKPNPCQWLIGDGSVFPGPSNERKDNPTDPGSGLWEIGGKETKVGSKFAYVETVSTGYLGTLVMGFEHVTPDGENTKGDEAKALLNIVKQLKKHLPGIRGFCVDSIVRGTHIEQLSQQGVFVINHPVAQSNPNADQGRYAPGRIEKTRFVKNFTHTHPNGSACVHPVSFVGSQPCHEVLNAEGDYEYQPLTITGVKTQKLKSIYVSRLQCEYTCHDETHTIYLRLDKAAPGEADENRGEVARVYPVGTPEFKTIYGWRNRTESFHNRIKDSLKRLPAYGEHKQSFFMLGLQLLTNAESEEMRKRPQKT